ncbi:MAG: tryptophan--tRNA ligase [Clostridia bacterium]|jgi:tryptophanyl-tRNA synthetase|nr:tryptophan--tRNA ligase [Clostridia bacterium]MBR5365702.1 tryptophan--tRNA ligase [Clostridia bacterium]MBR5680268.1 tryptophan--tRNA ligase [Clostridia bacterium]MCR5681400.1 tryptophan--tRNA ligase [Clostridiales bacterium]
MYKDKKVVFSGVQPSGVLTIGNYLGAIRNFADFSETYHCYYCVVDEHAITVRQVPADLRRRTYETLALYIACGLDPEKNTLFVQSHVSAHAELGWILDCYTMFGELSRMTQFKDKSAKNADNINAGLFTYPTLMAADILLYQSELVPVGVDQKQHLELTRDIALRFNQVYGDTFVVPDAYIPKETAKIMSLAEPEKKMSKSDENENATVRILDPKDVIIRKFKRAVTDSGSEIRYAEDKPGVSNLISIYSAFTGKTIEEVEKEFEGRGYGDFKLAVGEACADALAPVQAEFARLTADKAYLETVMKNGAEAAAHDAARTMSKVRRKIGFTDLRH